MTEVATELGTDVVVGAAAAGVGTLAAQGLASTLLPTIMAATGVIVPGVGTIHGTTTAVVAAFAAAPLLGTFALIGGGLGLAYFGYKRFG